MPRDHLAVISPLTKRVLGSVHGRRLRVLDLDPVARWPRAIAAIPTFRYQSFQHHVAGGTEGRSRPVRREPRGCRQLGEQGGRPSWSAEMQRKLPEIAIQGKDVEGLELDLVVVLPAVQPVKVLAPRRLGFLLIWINLRPPSYGTVRPWLGSIGCRQSESRAGALHRRDLLRRIHALENAVFPRQSKQKKGRIGRVIKWRLRQ